MNLKNKNIRSVALRLLSFREHSQHELAEKLRARGFPMEEIEPLCEDFSSKGYLDDRRVAESFLASALQKRDKGELRIQQELHRRGINRELIDATLSKYRGQVDEGAVAKGLAQRLLARGRDRKHVERYLWRQGFSSSQVRSALNLDNELIDS